MLVNLKIPWNSAPRSFVNRNEHHSSIEKRQSNLLERFSPLSMIYGLLGWPSVYLAILLYSRWAPYAIRPQMFTRFVTHGTGLRSPFLGLRPCVVHACTTIWKMHSMRRDVVYFQFAFDSARFDRRARV